MCNKSKEMTAEIIRRIRSLPVHRNDVLFSEFLWRSGCQKSRRADVFFVSPKPPYFTVTYEVKTERWDFLRDLSNAEKHSKARMFSSLFYYAAPVGLIAPEELPEWAGLMEFDLSSDCQDPRVVRPAPISDRADPSWELVAGIIKRLNNPSFRIEAKGYHLVSDFQLNALKSLIGEQLSIDNAFSVGRRPMMRALAIVSKIFRKDTL